MIQLVHLYPVYKTNLVNAAITFCHLISSQSLCEEQLTFWNPPPKSGNKMDSGKNIKWSTNVGP